MDVHRSVAENESQDRGSRYNLRSKIPKQKRGLTEITNRETDEGNQQVSKAFQVYFVIYLIVSILI